MDEMLEVDEKRKGLRGALRRKLQDKYDKYREEVVEKRDQDRFYKHELEKERKIQGYKYAKLAAQEKAREEAKSRFRKKSTGGLGGAMDMLGNIGGTAQKVGTGVSTGMDTIIFGSPKRAQKPHKPKRKGSKKKKRSSSPKRPDPFAMLLGG